MSKTIKVSEKTHIGLCALKVHPREPFDDVISRLIPGETKPESKVEEPVCLSSIV